MPETGSNTDRKEQILSIRLFTDGLYFVLSTEGKVVSKGNSTEKNIGVDPQQLAQFLIDNTLTTPEIDRVEVWLDTDQMTLVPEETFTENLCHSYLKINGHEPSPQQTAVASAPHKNIVAIMAWECAVVDLLRETYTQKVEFNSPIISSIERCMANSTEIILSGKLVYITLHNKTLEFAECLPFHSIADLLYYIETLKKEFGLDKRTLYIYGDQARTTAKQLKKFYGKVILKEGY